MGGFVAYLRAWGGEDGWLRGGRKMLEGTFMQRGEGSFVELILRELEREDKRGMLDRSKTSLSILASFVFLPGAGVRLCHIHVY